MTSPFLTPRSPHRVMWFPITPSIIEFIIQIASDLALSLTEATKSIHLRRRGGSYLEVTAIIDRVGRQRIFGNERGITGLETAIVLIAFVVVASVFAFASLSTGLFASEKAEESIKTGLHSAIGAIEVRGIKGTAAVNTTTSQPIGTGDGATTTFSMSNAPVIPGSHAVLVDGMTQTFGADYDVDYDTGLVTFTSAPASSASITADYTYYLVTNVKITMSSASAGYPVDLTGGRTVVVYLDPDSVETNITNYELVKLGSADADNLLESGEIFELSVDVSTYGLTDYDDFILQIKPAVGAVVSLGRTVPARVEPIMDLG
jgi:archaeal flagellin FlaB